MALARGKQERGEKAVLILEDGEATAPRGRIISTYPGTAERTGYPVYQGKGAIRLVTSSTAGDIVRYILSGPSSHARLLRFSLVLMRRSDTFETWTTFSVRLVEREHLGTISIRADTQNSTWMFWNEHGIWETIEGLSTVPEKDEWHRVEVMIDRSARKVISLAVNEESKNIGKPYPYASYVSTSTYSEVEIFFETMTAAAAEMVVDDIILEEA